MSEAADRELYNRHYEILAIASSWISTFDVMTLLVGQVVANRKIAAGGHTFCRRLVRFIVEGYIELWQRLLLLL